ncbi:MAG TPA: FAD-binding oxidoreductase [Solirubrobacteraceae bacterium]|nr:FAD-binding oxidoreductase [Solirubrobacteraceae bacterium]
MSTVTEIRPATGQEAARILAEASREGQTVRLRGGQTKAGWGCATADADLELGTGGLREITEHNQGDLTAVLDAGVPFAAAQARFAQAGQMLALDPPLGAGDAATVGGVVATADSGPLRHRYGGPRDLVIGVTVALADGTIAKSGGKVIKNVAGYDLAKLYAGSFGTLGLILSVSVRLHPLPNGGTTALGAATDPDTLAATAVAIARMPLEFEAVDVAWRGGRGGLLLRCAGREHARRASRAARRLQELGLAGVDTTGDDQALWERQRAGQRSRQAALVRIVAPAAGLAGVLRAADAVEGTLVGRAALGTSYVELAPERIAELRAALPGAAVATVLDAPASVRGDASLWGETSSRGLTLMRAVKAGFDPTGTLNPGVFVGGI